MNDKTDMAELLKHTRALRDMGCAVVVFTPEELRGAAADDVEECMIQKGSEAIDYFADDDEVDEYHRWDVMDEDTP